MEESGDGMPGGAGLADPASVQWTLWQLCDSALPTGGFAHSSGLEAAAAHGIVKAKHPATLHRFVRGVLANAAHLQLPLVRQAFQATSLEQWLKVDRVAHASITAQAARRASIAQGGGLLRAVQTMFPLNDQRGDMIRRFRGLVRGGPAFPEAGPLGDDVAGTGVAHGHHAPAFGFTCASLEVSESQTARAYMFLVARDVLSAATRLSLVGPMEAGRLLRDLSEYTETLVAAATVAGETTDKAADGKAAGGKAPAGEHEWVDCGFGACQVDPLQDIVQGLHDRLYSRMFNS